MRELSEDDALAVASAEAALAKDPSLPGLHAFLRRKRHARGAAPSLLAHVDEEITEAPEGPLRTSLLAERARLFAASDRNDDALAAWSRVLDHDPRHAAALRGKEAALALADDTSHAIALAEADHLGAMADAYVDDPATAAWLLVERAAILELRLGKVEDARRALARALVLDPRVGPVRRALVRHVSKHRDVAALVDLLDEEGRIEADPVRAARLDLEAATIAEGAMRETGRAVLLLERAAGRAPTARPVDLRVLGDLTRLLEAEGRGQEAARWRRARLRLVDGGPAMAEELRALARAAEQAGDVDSAIADLERSLEEQPDTATVAHLDRLLAAAGRHEPRIALWVTDAARAADPAKRVESLLRAAQVAERSLRRPDEAVRHLRTAWTTKPGHPEVLDALSRLLARTGGEGEVRPKLELYAQAADVAEDAVRKVAYLEKVALLAEETLGDFTRAAAAYEQVLALDPGRMSALLGLARSAARNHDARTLHRTLLAQARVTRTESEALALRTRAAAALQEADPALALATAEDVLDVDATHDAARSLVTRLHEAAGRWELVARSLEEHLRCAPAGERRALLLYLAEVQEVHLRSPRAALATLQRARDDGASDAHEPRLLAAMARALESLGHQDPRALRDAHEQLAAAATREDERAAHLLRAAEISEHRMGDDASALAAYEKALLATPDDVAIQDRLGRIRARVQAASGAPDPTTDPLDRALALVTRGEHLAEARMLLEAALAGKRAPVAALRLLEHIHRKTRDGTALAAVLAQQAEAFRAPVPKLGALWALAELSAWRLDTEPDPSTYARILAIDPDDPEALVATIRLRLPAALAGDEAARRAVTDALRRRSGLEPGPWSMATRLCLAHLLEAGETAESEDAAEEALAHYRQVLSHDTASVTAAWGMRRLAHRLGLRAEAVHAATTLAELTVDPRTRARHFVEAADLVTHADDSAGLGDANARRVRASSLLERALEAHPDDLAATAALIALHAGQEAPSDLLRVLRTALGQATERDAVVLLGTEVARVARDDLRDLGVATLAMQRVREVAPTHPESLLLLSELYLAQRAWPEAVETLESVVAHAREAEPRLTALFALGSIYDKVLARPADHERVLRAALAIEPESPRALRGLIEQLRGQHPAHDHAELAALLRRLAAAETDPMRQCEAFLEVADLEATAGDVRAAERSILEAIVRCPANARAFARLGTLFRGASGLDASGYARALQELISRGRDRGLADARWFAALGQLEVDTLKRLEEGIAHLEWAVQLDPTLHETRFELADAYARTKAREPAIRALLGLIVPDARPLTSLADAGVALALLERLFDQDKRPEEAAVVSELRAVLGELEPGRAEWLKARQLPPLDEHHTPLGRTSLIQDVLPKAGRHVLLEVAAASTGLDAKLLRTNLVEVGVHARDRVGPRSASPVRPVFDRVLEALGVEEVELVVAPAETRVRVLIQDTPWVLVPASFEGLPVATQVASLTRACTRILLGVPWLGELRDTAVLGWLVAVARQVVPAYGASERDSLPPDAIAYEPLVARAIGRRQKKLLEGLAPHLAAHEGKPPELRGFLRALEQCAARAAYLVSGELTATARAVAKDDLELERALAHPGLAGLTALLAHPLLGDTARFALTPEATALRQRVGSALAR